MGLISRVSSRTYRDAVPQKSVEMNPLLRMLINLAAKYASRALQDPRIQHKISKGVSDSKFVRAISKKVAEKGADFTPPPGAVGRAKDPSYHVGKQARIEYDKLKTTLENKSQTVAKKIETGPENSGWCLACGTCFFDIDAAKKIEVKFNLRFRR